ncbi:Calcium permeable stress-gated cation channel 1 [Phytophthora cinnamomi]|uniref:Calcium permeable stress-gated cation channel 1 n=1 Tax=Phytophthora cinnamomi TaxID=4785 RepID=UPI003559F9A5|nr:Calcium permeable stress-gated cation channel 1 [Phytophthora cinnamomi]
MADAASAAASVTDKAATEDLTPSTTIQDGMRVYFVIGAIGWIAFEVGRVKLQRAFYCREDNPETTNATVAQCHSAKVFAWLKLLFFTSDDDILEQCGMDTLFFLRFLRLCEKVTAVGILCSAANFPIYYYAKRDTLDPLYRMTLSHLDTNEMWRFWLTVVTMYLVSLTACFLLWKEYEEYIRRRHEFMSRKHTQQYSVVLNGLPPNLCTQQTLRNYLELLFPKSVLHVYVALECRDLEKLVAERVKVRNKLEHVLAQSAKTGERVMTRDKLLGGEQVDAVELYQEQLKELNTAVEKEVRAIVRNQAGVARQLVESSGDDETFNRGLNQNFDSARSVNFAYKEEELDEDALESRYIKSLKRQDKKSLGIMRPAGFVTFRSLKAAQSCTQILQSADPTQMNVEAAAHADDVVWENIGLSKNIKDTWFLISMALSTAIILLWTVPTGLVVSFAKVSTLEKQWSWLAKVIENHPWVKSLLEQLSPLMLSVMTALAPIIFGILSKREGHAFASQVDASLLNKLVIYQIYVTFLLPIIGGTVIDAVIGSSSTNLTNVSAILKLVSDSVAVQSSFFITYLLVKTGLNLTLILLRVTPIIKAAIYQVFAPKLTPRERSSPWFGLTSLANPGDFGASDQVSEYYLVLMLVLVFCAIAPILNYFAMLYLVLSDFVYRWAVMCVHEPSTQTSGTFFPSLYRFIVGALMFAQIIMASVLATKQVALPATFSIILPFLTLAFHLFVSSRYPKIALNLPLDQAVMVDSRRSRQMQDLERVLEDMYMQPAMLERGPLEPDYQGLSSDPNPENQLASPPPVEKDSFRSQDKQIFSPNNVQGSHPASYERMESERQGHRHDSAGGLV